MTWWCYKKFVEGMDDENRMFHLAIAIDIQIAIVNSHCSQAFSGIFYTSSILTTDRGRIERSCLQNPLLKAFQRTKYFHLRIFNDSGQKNAKLFCSVPSTDN